MQKTEKVQHSAMHSVTNNQDIDNSLCFLCCTYLSSHADVLSSGN